jgi:hypothetical protein
VNFSFHFLTAPWITQRCSGRGYELRAASAMEKAAALECVLVLNIRQRSTFSAIFHPGGCTGPLEFC